MTAKRNNHSVYLWNFISRVTIHGADKYDSILKLLELSSIMKLYVCATVYCAWYYHMDAIDAVKKANLLKREAKMKYGRFRTEMKRYESNLLMAVDGQMRFFHAEDFCDNFKDMFGKQLTDREYFAICQSFGAEMYAECLPLIKALEYKFNRLFNASHLKEAQALAMTSTADILWDMARKIFSTECKYCDNIGYMFHARFRDIFKLLDIASVADRWKDFSAYLVDPSALHTDAAMEHDISLGVKAVYEKWTDPLLYQVLQKRAIEAYQDELFANDEARNNFTKLIDKRIQHTVDCIKKQKMKAFDARQKRANAVRDKV